MFVFFKQRLREKNTRIYANQKDTFLLFSVAPSLIAPPLLTQRYRVAFFSGDYKRMVLLLKSKVAFLLLIFFRVWGQHRCRCGEGLEAGNGRQSERGKGYRKGQKEKEVMPAFNPEKKKRFSQEFIPTGKPLTFFSL